MHSNLSFLWFAIDFIPIPIVWGIVYSVVASFNYYLYFTDTFLPNFALLRYTLYFLFYSFAAMTLICHTMSMYINPGNLDYNIVNRLPKESTTFCEKCQKKRPIRAHHCKVCNRCVMKMDHHCPWIFNCVGYNNQKVFFLFLFYATFGNLIAFLCLVSRFFVIGLNDLFGRPSRRVDFEANFLVIFIQALLALREPMGLIFGTCLALGMVIGIGSLFCSQVYFVSHNITNVDNSMFDDNEECPWYAKTHRMLIFKSVMGLDSWWKRFLPVMESNKYNGGYTWELPYPPNLPKPKKQESEEEYCSCCCFSCKCCRYRKKQCNNPNCKHNKAHLHSQ